MCLQFFRIFYKIILATTAAKMIFVKTTDFFFFTVQAKPLK